MCSAPSSHKKTVRQNVKSDIAGGVSHFADQQQNESSSIPTTAEKVKLRGLITYSPSKQEKENGFDLTFLKSQEIMDSIHQLSQTIENREPLSPSKIKLHNNKNASSLYQSDLNSQVTFSPNK